MTYIEDCALPPEAGGDKHSQYKRVLIFNFFGGILFRGIPLYVSNLSVGLERCGIMSQQVRCPRVLRNLPPPILNLLFVLTEQFVMPLLGLRYDRVIYASNSASIFGSLLKRSAVIVHDFISLNPHNRSFAARYVRATQRVHAIMGRDVIYISEATERLAARIHRFPHSNEFRFPNAFYHFMEIRNRLSTRRAEYVLLCSGWGANKDLRGALNLYLQSGLYRTRPLHVLGLAGNAEIVDQFCRDNPGVSNRIKVLGKLDDAEVVASYKEAAWVWVHSKREGYGRSIAEARLCGSAVAATNIAPFREQQDSFTFLYSDGEDFGTAVCQCEKNSEAATVKIPVEHDLLIAEIQRYFVGNPEGAQ